MWDQSQLYVQDPDHQQGIKEIIFLSAAYYSSLDTDQANHIQKYIRPRFQQMIILLLALLNNEDLAEIRYLLKATYKLKTDRRGSELLVRAFTGHIELGFFATEKPDLKQSLKRIKTQINVA